MFEVFRLLCRRWTLLVPLLLLAPAVPLLGMTFPHGPWPEVSSGIMSLLRPPFAGLEGSPRYLGARQEFWTTWYGDAYSSFYLVYAASLCALAFVLCAVDAQEGEASRESSPLEALPLSTGRRMLAEVAGRAGVVFVYHLLAWGGWVWLGLNLPISTGALLASFVWPPFLAVWFAAVGVVVRWTYRAAGLLPALLLSFVPAMLAGKTVNDALAGGEGTRPYGSWLSSLESVPGLSILLRSTPGEPRYLDNAALLLTTAAIGVIGVTTAIVRARRTHVL